MFRRLWVCSLTSGKGWGTVTMAPEHQAVSCCSAMQGERPACVAPAFVKYRLRFGGVADTRRFISDGF